jgi:hypothetical protein
MTLVESSRRVPTDPSAAVLGGEVIDALAEAVLSPPDPLARAVAIGNVVRELYDTLQWLHGADGGNEEVRSLLRVVEEAQQHQLRMNALGARSR